MLILVGGGDGDPTWATEASPPAPVAWPAEEREWEEGVPLPT